VIDELLASFARDLEVGVDELEALRGLSEPDLQRFADSVNRSFADQDVAVQEGLDAAVRFIPRPLRGRAAKLLFPDGDRG
jgi:hypothetical protein